MAARPALLQAALVLLLVAPGATAAWDQYRGDAFHNGVVQLQEAPLDVVANVELGEGYRSLPAGAPGVETPHGPVLLRGSSDGCWLDVLAQNVSRLRALPLEGCTSRVSNMLGAYSARLDAAFVCVGGPRGARHVQAVNLTNADVLWGFSATDIPQPTTGFANWACGAMAFDVERDELVAILYSNSNSQVLSRLVSLSGTTGTLNWVGEVSGATSRPPDAPGPGLPVGAPTDPFIFPRVVTLTETGIVVLSTGEAAVSFRPVMTLFDRTGEQTGAYQTRPSDLGLSGDTASFSASWWAIGKGSLAALAFGGQIVKVNPQLGTIVESGPIQAPDETAQNIWWPAGAWLPETIVMGLPHSVVGVDATSLTPRWAFTDGTESSVREILPTTSGQVIVLLGDFRVGEGSLAFLDARNGELRQRLAIPFEVGASERTVADLQVLPLADGGLLVFDSLGHAARYGRAQATLLPAVELSTEYPAVGEAFEVRAQGGAAQVRSLVVDWGDGAVETISPGEPARHGYPEAGPRTFRVKAVYASGLTGTALVTVHVGAQPPPELTALQRAFAPENQELTFFLIGTVLTIGGVAFTLGRHRRRFNRLEQELAAVEEIRLLSTTDPRGAIQALKAYRERLPGDLARRRIDDSQYQVLDLRSARLLKVLRTRMFAPYDTRLSMRYHRLLDAAFEDAILQPTERAALVAALDVEEALRPEDRAEIARLLDEFTSHGVGGLLR